jgi:hypothetical protein
MGAVAGVSVLVVAYEAVGRREYRTQLRQGQAAG